MRFDIASSFLIVMLSTVIHSQSISVYKTKNTIQIDGDLSDWKTPFLGPFVIHNSGEKAAQNTFVSFLWDEENLYIAYNCTD